jgi:hypothetical protein
MSRKIGVLRPVRGIPRRLQDCKVSENTAPQERFEQGFV